MNHNIREIENKLKYVFQDKQLLENAFLHSSFVNEQPESGMKDNECLEFLGDAVLNLVIGHMLMRAYPLLKEGELSKLRANLVNEKTLAKIARAIDIGPHIHLGKGEMQTGGGKKKSILADAFEAIVAAVYLDTGFQAAFNFIENHFALFVKQVDTLLDLNDAKSKLQEYIQVEYKQMPQYRVVFESGPDHDKTFKVLMTVLEIQTEGIGKSKKSAEQDAAEKALALLKIE